jgi:hypothetical protein
MSGEPSRIEEYIGHAATLRLMADSTQYPEVRRRLLSLAANFELLADHVERWENQKLSSRASH